MPLSFPAGLCCSLPTVELDSGNFGNQVEPSVQVVGLGDGFVVLVEQSGWGYDSPRPLWIGRP